jgi:ribonuclease J
MKITFYGGVGEIGGNKIIVENDETRILLDFGQRMDYENEFFSEFLNPRTNSSIKDRITIGVLPNIQGIYRRDLLVPNGVENLSSTEYNRVLNNTSPFLSLNGIDTYEDYIEREGKLFVDAIFLSHAHLDHTGAIGFLNQNIPLYCSKITEILIRAIDDVTIFKSKALDSKTNNIDFYKKGVFPNSPRIIHGDIKRKCISLKDNEKVNIDNLSVTHFLQDHSIPGSSSFVVKCSDKKILYTGDIRFHGYNPMTIEEYANKVGNDINVMICEGTRIDSTEILPESKIKEKIAEKISETKGLVFVDFNWKDTTRYETIKKASEDAGRTFVINARLAYLLNKLEEYPSGNSVKVFLKRKGSCLYSPGDYTSSKYEFGLSVDWETNIDSTHYDNALTALDIKKHPDRYVMMLSYYDLGQIFDIADKNGKIPDSWFIKAQCAPFSDEMELDEERFINWLKAFGIGFNLGETPIPNGCIKKGCDKLRKRIERSHVSGHASRSELKELIELVEPQVLIPIHTIYPELFMDIVQDIETKIKVILPEYGKTYTF